MDEQDPRLEMVRKFRAQAEEARARAIRQSRIMAYVGAGACGVGAVVALGGGVAGLVVGQWGAALVGVLVAVGLLLAGAASLWLASSLTRPEQLRQTGLPARAKYLELTKGGLSIGVNNSSMRGNIAQFALKMEVHAEGRAPYTVVVKDFVPSTSVPKLVPGTWFAVFVDRGRPSRVLVDWDAGPLGA